MKWLYDYAAMVVRCVNVVGIANIYIYISGGSGLEIEVK